MDALVCFLMMMISSALLAVTKKQVQVLCAWVISENIHTTPKEEINPPTPFGCPNTFTIIRNNFSPLPLRTAEISSMGGVWIFSGTTQSGS